MPRTVYYEEGNSFVQILQKGCETEKLDSCGCFAFWPGPCPDPLDAFCMEQSPGIPLDIFGIIPAA